MQNFFLGMRAVLGASWDTLRRIGDYPLFWGFAVGFLVSTIAHAFLMTDKPRQISTVLFEDKSKAFEKLYPRREDGSFSRSYSDYSKMADRTKTSVLLAIFITTILILIVVLTK
ncbi:MAG: hypothetical protein WCO25_02125 [Candidatus Uhrbacteria bacterium]